MAIQESERQFTGLRECLEDFQQRFNTNERAKKLVKNWDRQIYVGLVTPFGAVLAGRQYTPAYELSAAFDVMGTQSSLFGQAHDGTPDANQGADQQSRRAHHFR